MLIHHFNISSTKPLYLVLVILFWLQWKGLYKCCQYSFGRKGRIIRAYKTFSALMNIYSWRWHMKWAVMIFSYSIKRNCSQKKCQEFTRNRCLNSFYSNHLSYTVSIYRYLIWREGQFYRLKFFCTKRCLKN